MVRMPVVRVSIAKIAESAAKRARTEGDEHERHGELEDRVDSFGEAGPHRHERGPHDEEHRRVTKPPRRGVSNARAHRSFFADHRRYGDDVIGLERMSEPLKKTEQKTEEDGHALSISGSSSARAGS